MSEIIEFPGGKERYQREMERVIEESLNIGNAEVKQCIKERVSETLAKYQNIPEFRLNVSLSISESDTKKLTEAISNEYREIVSSFGRELIGEICALHAKLCVAENGK